MALCIDWLGTVPYREAMALQERALEDRRAGRTGDRLLLLEHPPAVTLGRNTKLENLRVSEAELVERGIEVHRVARGGDVTYHGHGQLVGYPIVDLEARGKKDVVAFLREIEGALRAALQDLGIAGSREEGKTGVFVEGSRPLRKLASIGIGVKGWVTWHGFALNSTLDLEEFDVIVPCGLKDVVMSSVAEELGGPTPELFDKVRDTVAEHFERAFE